MIYDKNVEEKTSTVKNVDGQHVKIINAEGDVTSKRKKRQLVQEVEEKKKRLWGQYIKLEKMSTGNNVEWKKNADWDKTVNRKKCGLEIMPNGKTPTRTNLVLQYTQFSTYKKNMATSRYIWYPLKFNKYLKFLTIYHFQH